MHDIGKIQKVVVCKKGDFLFRQNEDTRDLYIIKTGKVKVFKEEGGVAIDLDIIGSGGIVGEIAIIDGGKRSASVVALEDTEAFVISTDDFTALSQKIPDWFQKIAIILAHRLREADGKIDKNMETDKFAHVAAAVLLVSFGKDCTQVSDNCFEIGLKTLENEVVDLLDIKYTDVTNAFVSLQKMGLLEVDKNKAIIKNR
jgi:CRP/FNR family transcriptional regulator